MTDWTYDLGRLPCRMGTEAWPTLLLWDVDRTLVGVGGIGWEILMESFALTTGRALSTMVDLSGRTDRYIVTAILAEHGIPVTDELIDRLFAAMTSVAPRHRDAMVARGVALAGAATAIATFARRPGVVQTLVTGNLRPIAEQKLTVLGLADGIDFEVGGYGAEDGVRAALVRLAQDRASRKYQVGFRPERVIVVGDTVHDIAGARDAGVRSIGVATGGTTAEELAAAGADLVLEDLTDTEALVTFACHGTAA